jgi:hypothetical protein
LTTSIALVSGVSMVLGGAGFSLRGLVRAGPNPAG